MGATKADDVPPDVRMRCYEVLFENYYPRDRAMISVFPSLPCWAQPSTTQPPDEPPATPTTPEEPPTDPAAQEWVNKMTKAYADTQTYQAVIHYSLKRTRDRWTTTEATDFKIGFDRNENKLLVDTHQGTLSSDGTHLRLKLPQILTRHVEVEAAKPLTYPSIIAIAPFWDRPPSLDLPLLLGDSDAGQLKWATATALEPDPTDIMSRPGLKINAAGGTWILRLNRVTNLISSAVFEMKTLRKSKGTPPVTLNFEIDVTHRNQPLEPAVFAMDLLSSNPCGSFAELRDAAGEEKNHGSRQ
jgi:hypothetical protein